jgi:uncharacterized protein YndB with AHSA1/START domain
VNARAQYRPGHAAGAEIEKDGEDWTLVLVRKLSQRPELVWQALTAPAELAEWAPFDADRNLATVGPMKLTTVGMPKAQAVDSNVKRAEAPRLLEYSWGPNNMRWELEAAGGGTRLKLWHNIDRGFIAWGAAGWHICLDVLDRFVAGEPIGRIVGGEAIKFEWQRLVDEYAAQFGIKAPAWPPKAS